MAQMSPIASFEAIGKGTEFEESISIQGLPQASTNPFSGARLFVMRL
jgi:hypothetical protein